MFLFITSVKHPLHSRSYDRVWGLLRDTLNSACNQTDENFRVIVVCNSVPDRFADIPRISRHTDFVQVEFPPVTESLELNSSHKKMDVGVKYAVGLREAAKHDPEYVMFVDADDFVGNDIVAYCHDHANENGWYIDKGYALLGDRYARQNHFNDRCGTCNIFSYRILTRSIDVSRISLSDRDAVLSAMDDYYLNFILGSHKYAPEYFKKQKTPLRRFPKRAAAWLLDHGENRGGNRAKKLRFRRLRPIDSAMRDYFSIPATPDQSSEKATD